MALLLLSWDWGPAFPSMGIWRPISIEAYNTAVLKYVKWEPYFIDGTWSIGVSISLTTFMANLTKKQDRFNNNTLLLYKSVYLVGKSDL
jgi:hypothetical protein